METIGKKKSAVRTNIMMSERITKRLEEQRINRVRTSLCLHYFYNRNIVKLLVFLQYRKFSFLSSSYLPTQLVILESSSFPNFPITRTYSPSRPERHQQFYEHVRATNTSEELVRINSQRHSGILDDDILRSFFFFEGWTHSIHYPPNKLQMIYER
jgi:hypothetical protein